jgi:hypothetical protein
MEPSSTTISLIIFSFSMTCILLVLYNKYNKALSKITSLENIVALKIEETDDLQSSVNTMKVKYQHIVNAEEYATTHRKDAEEFAANLRTITEGYTTNLKTDAEEFAINHKRDAEEYSIKLKSEAQEVVAKLKGEAEKEIADLKEQRINSYNAVYEETVALKNNLQQLDEKYRDGLETYKRVEEAISLYGDDLDVMEYGVYKPTYDFQTSEDYRAKLEYNYLRQKELVKADIAAHCNTTWTVEGSVTKGARMTKMQKKLMLLAFNGDCDGLIAKMRWNSATRTIEKINKTYEAVNKLGAVNGINISYEYFQLKLEQLALTHEFLNKLQEEKEEQRMIREQMREEERAKREFEMAEREAKEEERRYQKAINRAREDLMYASKEEVDSLMSQIGLLEHKLSDATLRKERAMSMAQQTKVGHIYIISNIGSFGENVYKIGMTRRLEPMDRVKELGDASVPFQFDVHAIIFSDNAPQMEYDLHKKFQDKRLNKINGRKEFFKITLDEIEDYVKHHAGATIEVTKLAEAKEYRESMAILNSLIESNDISTLQLEQTFPNSLLD